jgi:hypothetical protein
MSGTLTLRGVRVKAAMIAGLATAAGFAAGAKVGLGVLAGAAISMVMLESQAWLAAMCVGRREKGWKRRLGFLWLVKYPVLIGALYLIVARAPVDLVAFLVGVGVVPAAILWQAVS